MEELRPWLPPLADLDPDRWVTVASPVLDPQLPVRVVIPRFEHRDEEPAGPVLTWSPGQGRLGEALDDGLWEFIDLSHDSDEGIARFADRYGLLSSIILPDPAGTHPVNEGWRVAAGVEPLRAWRLLAAGVGALLELATRFSQGEDVAIGEHFDDWMTAFSAVTTVMWLAGPDRTGEPPTPEQVSGVWLAGRGLDVMGPTLTPRDHFRWLLSGLLTRSGVRLLPQTLDSHRDDRAALRAAYHLPVTGLGRLEQLPAVKPRSMRKGQEPRSLLYGRVANLLPVIAVQVARAVEPEEHHPCTRCGLLARVVGRRPSVGREWFGDHAYCRRVHRAGVVRRAAARRYQKVKGADLGLEIEPERE